MSRIALLSLCLLAACAAPAESQTNPDVIHAPPLSANRYTSVEIGVVRDPRRGVTCWYMAGGYNGPPPALSCLPDAQLKKADR